LKIYAGSNICFRDSKYTIFKILCVRGIRIWSARLYSGFSLNWVELAVQSSCSQISEAYFLILFKFCRDVLKSCLWFSQHSISNKTRVSWVLSCPTICWIHYVQISEHLSRASQPSISSILKNAQQCSTMFKNALKHSDMLINYQ